MTAGGVVLAGGRSRRMGTAKALLDWHGRPLVAHVAAALGRAVGDGPVVVVRAPGQALPELPAGVLVAQDPVAGRGPLQGLAAGLRALEGRADAAVVIATDQPFAAALAGRLLSAARPGDEAVCFDGQPLGALYGTAVAAAAEARLRAGGDASLRGLLAALSTRVLPLDAQAAAALRSLDTRAAYAEALSREPR